MLNFIPLMLIDFIFILNVNRENYEMFNNPFQGNYF